VGDNGLTAQFDFKLDGGGRRALWLSLISSSAEGEDGESSPEMSVQQRAVSDWRCGSGGGSGHTHLRLSWPVV
jgi:hypothetical protein